MRRKIRNLDSGKGKSRWTRKKESEMECENVMRGNQRKPHHTYTHSFHFKTVQHKRNRNDFVTAIIINLFFFSLFAFSFCRLLKTVSTVSVEYRWSYSTFSAQSMKGYSHSMLFIFLPANLQSSFLVIVNIKYLRSFRPFPKWKKNTSSTSWNTLKRFFD